jgi:hypothetical protein
MARCVVLFADGVPDAEGQAHHRRNVSLPTPATVSVWDCRQGSETPVGEAELAWEGDALMALCSFVPLYVPEKGCVPSIEGIVLTRVADGGLRSVAVTGIQLTDSNVDPRVPPLRGVV